MATVRTRALALIAALALGACSQDALFSDGSTAATPPSPISAPTFQPSQVSGGPSTGTAVGARVQQMRSDFVRLMGELTQQSGQLQAIRGQATGDAQQYYTLVAGISARLQVGTTPGNPELVAAWNQAQTQLEKLNTDLSQMNTLATTVSGASSQATFLLESVRATYGVSGAVDEDHRQLKILENEINQSIVLVDRLLSETSQDIARQTAYVAAERNNLVTLNLAVKNGRLLGPSVTNRTFQQSSAAPTPTMAPGVRSASPAAAPVSLANRRPLLIVRFDQPRVQYEQALYAAIAEAIQRKPDATFDLLAVAPARGSIADVSLSTTASKRHAENVLRSMTEMGVNPNRVGLASTTSQVAQNSEVHLYVR
ncbi:MAG: hypothetical protein K0S54_1427 [Alphaproteobacteria bacterium]|jgi:hypothetical protein|nr:hypothetical protein [Alphaproteobacteria bacterium]